MVGVDAGVADEDLDAFSLAGGPGVGCLHLVDPGRNGLGLRRRCPLELEVEGVHLAVVFDAQHVVVGREGLGFVGCQPGHQDWCAVAVDVVAEDVHVLGGWDRVLVPGEVLGGEEPDLGGDDLLQDLLLVLGSGSFVLALERDDVRLAFVVGCHDWPPSCWRDFPGIARIEPPR